MSGPHRGIQISAAGLPDLDVRNNLRVTASVRTADDAPGAIESTQVLRAERCGVVGVDGGRLGGQFDRDVIYPEIACLVLPLPNA